MRVFIISVLLLLPFAGICQKQQAKVDSLKERLSHASHDTDVVRLLYWVAFNFRVLNTDSGIKYAQQDLDLANKINKPVFIANANEVFGENYLAKGDYDKALRYCLTALKIYESIQDRRGMREQSSEIGQTYRRLKQYDKALEYMLKAAGYVDTNNIGSLGIQYSIIGAVYQEMGKNELAIGYCNKAYVCFVKTHNLVNQAITLLTIGNAHSSLYHFDSAVKYYVMMLKDNEKVQMPTFLASGYGSWGEMLFNKTERIHKQRGDNHLTMEMQNDLRLAAIYLDTAVKVSKQIDDLESVMWFADVLWQVNKMRSDYRSAFSNYRIYVTAKDSVYSNDSKLTIANLETQRERDLKEKQLQINSLVEAQKHRERYGYLAGIAAILLFTGGIARAHNSQKKANREKTELLLQKDMLMKEIHHRVKNNLQVISALLELQLINVADEKAKGIMVESNTRVRSISLIHQQLYQHKDITSIELSKFTDDLLAQVAAVFKTRNQQVTLENRIPESTFDIDTAVPLGLILNELFTNSFKYAFKDAQAGHLYIRLQTNGGNYKLVYKDSGPGLPANFSISSHTLGMRMLNSLSKQIGGKFNYDVATQEFIITFKDSAERRKID